MKTNNKFNILWIVCIGLICHTSNLWAQKITKQKNFSKTYQVNAQTALNIENKFGKVHIQTNALNEIKIEVTILGKGNDEEQAQRALDRIEIRSEEVGNEIKIRTSFESSLSGSVDKMTNKTNKNSSFEVNYMVSMPSTVPLNLKNSFGDVYLANHKARLQLKVSYGSLKAEQLSGQDTKDVQVSFGNALIDYVEQGNLRISYGSLNLQKGEKIELYNGFSKAEIGTIGYLKVESKYGGLKIGSIKAIQGESSFSGFEIGLLSEALNMTTKYDSDFKVKLDNNFKNFDLDAQFSSVHLDFGNASFTFEVDTKFGNLHFDKDRADMQKEIKTHTSAYYAGKYGNGGSAKVKLFSKYGSIHFK